MTAFDFDTHGIGTLGQLNEDLIKLCLQVDLQQGHLLTHMENGTNMEYVLLLISFTPGDTVTSPEDWGLHLVGDNRVQ